MILHEPSVALTDLGLALECSLFVFLLPAQAPNTAVARAFRILFATLAFAAFLGFVVHGFLVDKSALPYRLAWAATLLSIGVAALATTLIAARLCCSATTAQWIVRGAVLLLIGYAGLVVIGYRHYGLAVAFYLPATLFLFGALALRYWRSRAAGSLLGIAGLALSLLAAGIQQLNIGLHPEYLDHNTLYHLVQALGLWLLYLCGRRLQVYPRKADAVLMI